MSNLIAYVQSVSEIYELKYSFVFQHTAKECAV